MDIKGTILRAKDGHPVPVLERDGLKRHLGSMYDGAVAASCWCEKVVSKRTENIILFGKIFPIIGYLPFHVAKRYFQNAV